MGPWDPSGQCWVKEYDLLKYHICIKIVSIVGTKFEDDIYQNSKMAQLNFRPIRYLALAVEMASLPQRRTACC